jgi:UPF0042 nucleotide-binding protein
MAEPTLTIVTGLSGAGKSQALRCFEDLGFFCVENMPPGLIPKFAELCSASENRRVAVVMDIRGDELAGDMAEGLRALEERGDSYQILFLDASDEALVRRFKETRRKHPLSQRYDSLLDAIRAERAWLSSLKARADRIIDTSEMSARQLREEITSTVVAGGGRLTITVVSFGYKFGIPPDSDLVFDVRFLANPNYIEELRPLDGTDERVREYVLGDWLTRQYCEHLVDFLRFLLPHYVTEGKSYLGASIGCTGGRHRSVVIADEVAKALQEMDYGVRVHHRDVNRR